MRYYFAPMEGITTYLYRRLHYKYFKGVDVYFTPFVSPTMHGSFVPRERKDILPENNAGIPVVPQILANNSSYFTKAAEELAQYGYREVNLNLGCPSGTVTAKGKGAGALADPDRLLHFLDEIFERQVVPISIKTRIGYEEEEEWKTLLEIFNRFPIKELIVHPRVRQDFYKNPIHKSCFLESLPSLRMPVCYNGDIVLREQLKQWENCDSLQSIMIGRGLLQNPGLLLPQNPKADVYWAFHDALKEAYYEELGNHALYKMKELWTYLSRDFQNVDKCLKKIRKAKNEREYDGAILQLKEEAAAWQAQ